MAMAHKVHVLSDSESKRGYMSDRGIFGGFNADAPISSVTVKNINGLIRKFTVDCDGNPLHIHRSYSNRMDGLTKGYKIIEGRIVDVVVVGTEVFITELPNNSKSLDQRAAYVHALVLAAQEKEAAGSED